jgi:uncharacterized membrane protein YdjX (TVP38/TMEM64 family)
MTRRLIPLAVIVLGLGLFLALGLQRYLSFDALKDNREYLLALVDQNLWSCLVGFALIYILVVALSAPGGGALTLAGGFLFGTWLGGAVTVMAATIGAGILFLAARSAFGDFLRQRAGPSMAKFEDGFRRDAFSYLLVLRLVPLFPFFLVNLAPALFGVPFRIFMITTFFGIMPGTFVFASVGNGLGAVFDAGQVPDLRIILKPEILGPLLGLALLSLIPVFYRRFGLNRSK